MHEHNRPELQRHPTTTKPFTRRSVVRAAAWSVPAVSVAAAAPALAVSPISETINNLTVAWGPNNGRLLHLGLPASPNAPINATLLPNGPNHFTVTNPLSSSASGLTATVSISWLSGLIVGNLRGFAVGSAAVGTTITAPGPITVTPASGSPTPRAAGLGLTFDTVQSFPLPTLPAGETSIALAYVLTEVPTGGGGSGAGALPVYTVTVSITGGGLSSAKTAGSTIATLVSLGATIT